MSSRPPVRPTPLDKTIEPDLGTERIPKERYTSPEYARREWERMWTRVWLLAGREADVAAPGDWFTFDAKKGEVWWVDVWSHRLGVGSDPFLLVQRIKRNERGEVQSADAQA